MTDRFDEAKRALEGVPAPDVWSDAERRAEAGTVVPLAPAAPPPRHRGRWVAAAAVVVLGVGTVAVLATDDRSPVDSGPSNPGPDDPTAAVVTTYQADGACQLGITGEPLPEPVTVSPAETFISDPSGQPAIGTLVEGSLNATQTFAVQVPGQTVTDLVGERVEEVEIARGTASLWLSDPDTGLGPVPADPAAVQLRWFTGSQEACESFTVTVAGGTEDENRHAAVDLGERVLMSSELDDSEPNPTPVGSSLAGEWQVERSTTHGGVTDGNGSRFTFDDTTVGWGDGCNEWSANYSYYDQILYLEAIGGTDVLCGANPTTDTINEVMAIGGIAAFFDDDGLLVLRTLDGELLLRPTADDPGDAGAGAGEPP